MMTTDLIDRILRDPRGATSLTEEALLSLAELSVSVLRMIDARRERGIAFESSYNEQELRRALASKADQKFPPGPPMVSSTIELARAVAAETGPTDSVGLLARRLSRIVIDQHTELARRRAGDLTVQEADALHGCSVHCQDERQLAFATRAIDKVLCRTADISAAPVQSSVLDETHDFQRFEHRTRGLEGRTTRQLKIVCRCGWAADWIDLEPDGDVGRSAARDLLAAHVTEATDLAHPRSERNP
jgi:hypothetical protein